jgi:hypothetical protein
VPELYVFRLFEASRLSCGPIQQLPARSATPC